MLEEQPTQDIAEGLACLPDECLAFVLGHLSSLSSLPLIVMREILLSQQRSAAGATLKDIYECFGREVFLSLYFIYLFSYYFYVIL